MCGICGILKLSEKLINQNWIESMNKIQQHRGPDHTGKYIAKDFGLGHTRLSIIDLSDHAHQPMSHCNQRFWITYNGEIYNYKDLKSILIKKGHVFKSDSDTEVILHLFEDYGTKAFEKLNGIFAFALYDQLKKECYLVRDQVGVKPLYYYCGNDFFAFASEMRALMTCSFIQKKINWSALNHHLTFGSVIEPDTLIENVHLLESGSYLTLKNNQILISKYYDMDNLIEETNDGSIKENTRTLKEKLEQVIKNQMIADVPVGAFLSGGLDSSLITSVSSDLNHQIKTYTIGFEGQDSQFDESSYARIVSQQLKTDHREVMVSQDVFYDELQNILNSMDQPTMEGINTYFVSKSVDYETKSVLSGLGADEIFGGYYHFYRIPQIWKYHQMMKMIPNISHHFFKNSRWMSKLKVFKDHSQSLESLYLLFRGVFNSYEKQNILPSDVFNELELEDSARFIKRNHELKFNSLTQQLQYYDVKYYMKNTLLRDIDCMGMRFSLEVRVPFLDPELIQFGLSLNDQQKVHKKNVKRILKSVSKDFLSTSIVNRQKQGFLFPTDRWIQHDMNHIFDILSCDSQSKILFDEKDLKRMIKQLPEFQFRKISLQRKVWLLLATEIWLRNFV